MKRLIMIAAAVCVCIAATGQQKRHAVVELSGIYMRIAPDYESALETQELMGTVVEVTGEKGYWREIVSPQPYKAWCTEKGIVEMGPEAIEAYKVAPKCIFKAIHSISIAWSGAIKKKKTILPTALLMYEQKNSLPTISSLMVLKKKLKSPTA